MARARPTISIRWALVRLLVVGIVVPAALVWAVGHVTARAAVAHLGRLLADQVASATVDRTLRYFETAPTALSWNGSAVELGMVDPGDREGLLRFLRAGLAANPKVTWYSFAGADGAYLSAYRPPEGGTRVTWREQCSEGQCLYRDFRVEDDGTWSPLPEQRKPYDPRTRAWYEAAAGAGGAVWSRPFLFASGPPGLIVSQALRDADGAVRGVWGIEYELSYVSEFLAGYRIGRRGRAYLLTPDGAVIGHPLAAGRTGAADGWIVVEDEDGRRIAQAATHRDPWLRLAYEVLRGHPQETFAFTDPAGEEIAAVWAPFPAGSGVAWWVLVVVPVDDILGSVRRNAYLAAAAAALITLVFLGLGLLAARRRLSAPLAAIAQDLDRMARLDVETASQASDTNLQEVASMVAARERMRSGLRSFQTYVPAQLVRELMERGEEARLGGEERVLTVMFTDIADFTAISERIGDPQRLVTALGEYLEAVSRTIREEHGTVDKYVGDAVMAFWGAPAEIPDHAVRACRAAWRAQRRLAALRAGWEARGLPAFLTRIGVNTGPVLVGNIGWEKRMNYTVMGDAVNLASRLEGVCKVYGVGTTIGPGTWEAAKEAFVARPLDVVTVKGKAEAVVVRELLGPRDEVDEATLRFATLAAEGFDLYLARRFDEALARFEAARASRPDDVSTVTMIRRCEHLAANPPDEGWTGVCHLTGK